MIPDPGSWRDSLSQCLNRLLASQSGTWPSKKVTSRMLLLECIDQYLSLQDSRRAKVSARDSVIYTMATSRAYDIRKWCSRCSYLLLKASTSTSSQQSSPRTNYSSPSLLSPASSLPRLIRSSSQVARLSSAFPCFSKQTTSIHNASHSSRRSPVKFSFSLGSWAWNLQECILHFIVSFL